MKITSHKLENLYQTKNNCLIIGNSKITEHTDRYPDTPVYIYDNKLISHRISQLRTNLPKEIKLHYAIKANPMPEVVKHIAPMVDGLDVASAKELRLALQTSANLNHISFAGPGKSNNELIEAIGSKIIINAESFNEILRAEKIGENIGTTPNIAIRVNPDFELKSSGMKMAGGPKPFGIDAENVPLILEKIKSMHINFVGFHIFSGSQNLNCNSIIEAQNKTIDLAIELSKHTNNTIKLLNIGGGFGIPYFPGDQPLDLNPINSNLIKLIKKAKRFIPETEIVIELGRYIIGEAGIYACKVIDRKISRGHIYLITNGGLHHHLAASGNFGQVIRKNYPVCIANKITSTEKEVASIVGPLCTPLDILADKIELPKANVGDIVVVFQSGAYGYTASPINFLSHPEPIEIFV